MFNVISGYWNSQSETASEINNQFENRNEMGEKLYEEENTTFPSSL